MPTFETVIYEIPAPGVARITQNRPEARNAQNYQLTYDLNAAFDEAAADESVKVIILAGAGPHFSAGHDLRGGGPPLSSYPTVGTWREFNKKGAEGYMAVEEEIYLGMCRRWRNILKPTIAQVQGKCIAGGLMLAWVCDLIVASDDAMFSDPVVQMGVCGVEYFAHPWELGARKAKEMLFTADWVTAQDAYRLGMVNHVVPREELESFTLALAEKIAQKPSFALKLAKEAVNQTLEAQGQWQAMLAVFNLHQLAHSHNQELYGMRIDPSGIPGAVRRQ
ncbi:enoyl-CoA hydratase [Tepidiforma bonchosmolovskayae]|uniref:Enoyl-CoA hydratase n=1 Tax=Tepidiforma bonchosmolovskayae TaxID=2601677 RepID=A0ABX6C000_9CHLR|nr:enoyl-CoA hydratase [Tepidiforma bonchosmolovskayae]QFG02596.1 enoyl-CoA hydratase [Tepidiforma bonchosmolovskayae]